MWAALAGLGVAALVGLAGWMLLADGDPASTRARLVDAGATVHPRSTATDVCAPMVGDAVVTVAEQPLARPQVGTWLHDRTRYRCTYDLGDGKLVIRVEVTQASAEARATFRAVRRGFGDRSRLYGIGDDGFTVPDGTVVVLRDNFVLTVDPTHLADRFDRGVVAWFTTRTIFDCW